MVMTKMQFLDFLREIKKTFSSFLSILIIISLGVGTYSGLRSMSRDMRLTADKYFDQQKLMDIHLRCDFGIDKSDITAAKTIENVKIAECAYEVEASIAESNYLLKVMSISKTGMNAPSVVEGRLPKTDDECAIDPRMAMLLGYKVGDTIKLDTSISPLENPLKQSVFTITAIANSPLYISVERGSGSIGDGAVDAFLLLPEQAFTLEYYTSLYLLFYTLDRLDSFDTAYEEVIDAIHPRLEKFVKQRSELRQDEINLKIQTELEQAESQLQQGKQDLEIAQEEIQNAEKELNSKVFEAESKLKTAQQEIENSRSTIQTSEDALTTAKNEVAQNRESVEQAEAMYAQLQQAEKELSEAKENINALQVQIQQLEAQIQELLLLNEEDIPIEFLQVKLSDLQAQRTALQTEHNTAQANWERKNENVLAQRQQIEAQMPENVLAQNREKLNAATIQIKENETELQNAKVRFEEAEKNLDSGKKEMGEQKDDGKTRLEKAKEEYQNAERELKKHQQTYEETKQDLLDIPTKISWHILDRTSNAGYINYISDTDRLDSLASVFPAIFFLVAALMALSTMTRMVETKRSQIGTMRTIGFKKIVITVPFILYGFISSFLGSVLGFFLGSKIIPTSIYNAYRLLYSFPDLSTPYRIEYFVIAVLFAVGSVCLATIGGCLYAFLETPSQLMRPRAPKPGKRILLERITLIWNKFSFKMKITSRNLFRYKMRFFLTVIGIAGCMSLIITGFGIGDSIRAISGVQFGEINCSDLVLYLNDDNNWSTDKKINTMLEQNPYVEDTCWMMVKPTKIKSDSPFHSACNLIVPESVEKLKPIMKLRDRVTKAELNLTENGAIITEKMAEALKINVGDSVSFEVNNRIISLPVTAITENYIGHFIYITPNTYSENVLGNPEPQYGLVYLTSDKKENTSAIAEAFLAEDGVATAVHVQNSLDSYEKSLASINIAVLVIIIAAALLAFIVIYNLNNINIMERTREIATLKVLGYRSKEITAYILKESIFLTVLGVVFGIFGGKVLHSYLILTIETEAVMFGRILNNQSIVYSALLTVLFSIIVNSVSQIRLKKISMTVALK